MKNSALCPLDGRYSGRLGALRSVMSEAAFVASRVRAELAWFELLSTLHFPHFKALSASEKQLLTKLKSLSEEDVELVRALEF